MNVKGVEELARALRKGADIRDVANAVKLNGAEMQAKAQRYAAVDTGFMKRGIVLEFTDDGYSARVEATAEYSAYVNYGTRFQPAQPFLTPAFYEQEKKFIADMKRLLK